MITSSRWLRINWSNEAVTVCINHNKNWIKLGIQIKLIFSDLKFLVLCYWTVSVRVAARPKIRILNIKFINHILRCLFCSKKRFLLVKELVEMIRKFSLRPHFFKSCFSPRPVNRFSWISKCAKMVKNFLKNRIKLGFQKSWYFATEFFNFV